MADKKFEEHMMYKDGETEKAQTYQEHLKLKKMGFGHKKPAFKMKSPLKGGWWAQQTKGHGGPSRSGESSLKGKRGMWDNIHAKKKRGDKSTDDRPSAEAWAENTK